MVAYTYKDEDQFYPKAKAFIEKNLRATNGLTSMRIKYLWLAEYFNYAVKEQNPDFLNLRLKRLRIKVE